MWFLVSIPVISFIHKFASDSQLTNSLDVELKARIEAFKSAKKGKKIAEAGIMEMDTSAG